MFGFVVDNLVSQFAARFEPGGEDHLYFHNAGANGLPCSYDEALGLSRTFDRTVRRTGRLMLVWALLAGVAVGVVSAIGIWAPANWEVAAIILLPFPYAVIAIKRASDAPLEAFRMRSAVAPPVDAALARHNRLAAFPSGAVWAMIAVNALLAWQVLKDGLAASDWGYIALILFSVALIAAILKAKRGAR